MSGGDAVDPTASTARVLLVEDESAHAELMLGALEAIAEEVRHVETGAAAYARIAEDPRYDLVVLDVGLPDVSGLDVLRWIRERPDPPPVVFVTADDTLERGVEALREGADHYVAKRSGYLTVLIETVEELLGGGRRVASASVRPRRAARPTALVGASPAIREVRRRIEEFGPTSAGVLICGETGTGKELVARGLHEASRRAEAPFVTVNCAAVPGELMESEFFGHVKGAFTTALSDAAGYFTTAEGGTLFLDEIGDLPLQLQAKLLRVLEDGTFRPVGARQEKRADVRVLAATNRELRELVAEGHFRPDLYYRLDVLRIEIPPLRERRGDIPLLAELFLERCTAEGAARPAMASEAVAQLMAARWEGNVRQLKHVVERSALTCRTGILTRFDMGEPIPFDDPGTGNAVVDLDRLTGLLTHHRGRLGPVADALGVSVRTVQRRMKEHGLELRDFRRSR